MSDEESKLVRVIYLVGKGARASVKPLLLLLISSLITTLMSVVYFRWAIELNWWWSLVPLYLMFLPLLGLTYYWFALDGISSLPESLVESKQVWAELKMRYAKRRQKREIVGIGPIATIRRMLLLGGLLWDSRDVLDTASNAYGLVDLFNPLFWLLQLISLICTVVFCSLFVVTCAVHFFFF